MTWVQWLKGTGQPTGPTLTKRRILHAVDTVNEAVYFFEAADSNATPTIYKLWVDGYAITLDSFTGPSLSGNSTNRAFGLFVRNGELIVTGNIYSTNQKAVAYYTAAPVTSATPTWTTVIGTQSDSGGGMAFPTPSAAAGREWSFSNAILVTGNHVVNARDGVAIGTIAAGGGWNNVLTQQHAWSLAVTASRSLYASRRASGGTVEAGFVNASGGWDGSLLSTAWTTAGPEATFDALQQAFLLGDKAVLPCRDTGGYYHTMAVDESARTVAQGRVNADLRGGLQYDAGAGVKAWAFHASAKTAYSSADGATWAADVAIDNYPGSDGPATVFPMWSGELAVLGAGGELWVLDLAVPVPPEEPTDERAAFKRMARDSSNPGAIGFLSDHLTLTASSEHTRFPATNLQSFAYYGPNRAPEVGRSWRSLVDTSVALDWDTGVTETELALALFFVEGQRSLGLDVLDFDVTITVLTGATSPATGELFDLVLSPSTGNWSRKAKDLTIRRYVRFLIEGAGGAGGGPVGFFQAARAFFTDLQQMVTNYSNAKFSESDVGISTPGGSVRKKLLAMDFELVGAEAGDLTVWNQLRGSSRERDFHLQPNVPMVFDPDPTGSLDPDGVGHFGPRCCWLRSGEPGLNKAIPTADGIYSSRLELVSL